MPNDRQFLERQGIRECYDGHNLARNLASSIERERHDRSGGLEILIMGKMLWGNRAGVCDAKTRV